MHIGAVQRGLKQQTRLDEARITNGSSMGVRPGRIA
jgi:hypothetical protein